MRIRFTAPLHLVAHNRCVDVPGTASRRLGGGTRIPVGASVLGTRFESTLVPRGNGLHRLFVPASVCRAHGFEPGDEVVIDLSPPGPVGPDPLLGELAASADPDVVAAYLSASPADRRQALKWLSSAKAPETRARRLRQLIERLRARL